MEYIDALRALALLGVIIMNIGAMSMRFEAMAFIKAANGWDYAAMAFDLVLLQGKARSCFAFLFGVGFAILMLRAEASGQAFGGFYVRRMLALLLFGLFNQIFLFWGDILATYALLGLLLIPFRRLSERAVLRLGLLLVLAPPLIAGLAEALLGHRLPNIGRLSEAQESARGLIALTSPSYLDAVQFSAPQALHRYLTGTASKVIYDLAVFGLFLLGSWTVRRGVALDPAAHRPLFRSIAAWCIPSGLLLSLVHALGPIGLASGGLATAAVTASFAGFAILALGYMAALTLLFTRTRSGLVQALAPAGRMALTNYLASGAIGGWVFYGYGLGLMGEMNVAALNLFALALFAALLLFSRGWLARFRFGPAEWLWRCLSHAELQPLRRPRPLVTPVPL